VVLRAIGDPPLTDPVHQRRGSRGPRRLGGPAGRKVRETPARDRCAPVRRAAVVRSCSCPPQRFRGRRYCASRVGGFQTSPADCRLTTIPAFAIGQPHVVAFRAYSAGWLHRALPPHVLPAAPQRQGVAARNQARRHPGHRPQDRQPRQAVQPPWQRSLNASP
jgi:hypothetical protein